MAEAADGMNAELELEGKVAARWSEAVRTDRSEDEGEGKGDKNKGKGQRTREEVLRCHRARLFHLGRRVSYLLMEMGGYG